MPEIVVYLAAGRTNEQKRSLLKNMTQAMVDTLGTPPDNIVVTIVESPLENKAKGGIPFTDRHGQPRK